MCVCDPQSLVGVDHMSVSKFTSKLPVGTPQFLSLGQPHAPVPIHVALAAQSCAHNQSCHPERDCHGVPRGQHFPSSTPPSAPSAGLLSLRASDTDVPLEQSS